MQLKKKKKLCFPLNKIYVTIITAVYTAADQYTQQYSLCGFCFMSFGAPIFHTVYSPSFGETLQ